MHIEVQVRKQENRLPLLAFCDVSVYFDDYHLKIKGVKYIERKDKTQTFIAFPNYQDKDGKYQSYFVANEHFKEQVFRLIEQRYHQPNKPVATDYEQLIQKAHEVEQEAFRQLREQEKPWEELENE